MIKGVTIFGLLCHIVLFLNAPALAQEKEGYIRKQALEVTTPKGLLLPIELLSDKEGNPVFYAAHIATEVCSDTLCRPINLMIYWDLLGRFTNFRTPENSPLTKFDHVEFTEKDNQKLREILADDRSMLKDYEAEDLIDRNVKVRSSKVDAVTGATSKSFQDVIVSGAVYTVHTLWRIVNGVTSSKILAHTKGLLNDRMIKWMLVSGNSEYQRFILTELPADKLKPFTIDIIGLITSKDEFVPHFALEKIPAELWTDGATQQLLLSNFNDVHLEVQNTLLAKFRGRKLSSAGLKVLIQHLDKLNNSQVDKVFEILANNTEFLDKNLKRELSGLLNHPKSQIAQGVDDILKNIKK